MAGYTAVKQSQNLRSSTRRGRWSQRSHRHDRVDAEPLDQTQLLAASHRRPGKPPSSGAEVDGGAATGVSAMLESAMPAPMMVPSVSLGDSTGSEKLPSPKLMRGTDTQVNGGVVSDLGDSYIDGTARRSGQDASSYEEQEQDGLAEHGVLGLLAQIYTGQNPGRPGTRAPVL